MSPEQPELLDVREDVFVSGLQNASLVFGSPRHLRLALDGRKAFDIWRFPSRSSPRMRGRCLPTMFPTKGVAQRTTRIGEGFFTGKPLGFC